MIKLFRVFIPTSVVALFLSEIVLISACYFLVSGFTLSMDPQLYLIEESGWAKITIVVLCILLGFYFQDLYTDFRIESRILLVQQVCLAVGIALLVQALLGYLSQDLMLPRWLMIIGSFLVVLIIPGWRMVYWTYVLRALRTERILLLGNASILAETAELITAKPELGYHLLGYLSEGDPVEFPSACLGSIAELKQVYATHRPTRIVVGMAERRNRLPMQELLDIRFAGTIIEDVADTYEMATRRVCTRKLNPSQLVFTAQLGPSANALAIQSGYSFVLGVIAFVIALPIMLLVALAVRLSSPGPILYRQRRVGLNGRIFTIYKFRSMYVDAEARTGPVWAKKNDPRITPLGRWLRKLRLDELPQLWNVVRGDMCIVGPRPERPEFVETLSQKIPYYRQRHAVKPGVTGWAQINHKYGDTELDAIIKLEYDLYYIKHVAPALDAYIIFHTIKVMLLSEGAQ